GKPLLAVEHPAVAVPTRARRELRGIGAGGVALGHEKRRAHVAGEQRLEVALLLLGGARERQDLRVARIGGLTAERVRCVEGGSEDLVEEPELDLAVPLSAELGRQVAGPQVLAP